MEFLLHKLDTVNSNTVNSKFHSIQIILPHALPSFNVKMQR